MLHIDFASFALSLNQTFGLYETKERLYRLRTTFIGLMLGKKLNLPEEEMKKIFLFSLAEENSEIFKEDSISVWVMEITFLARTVADFLRGRKVCIFAKEKIKKYFMSEYLSAFPSTPAVVMLLELMEEEAFWFNLEEEFLFLDILKMTMGYQDIKLLTDSEVKKVIVLLARLIDNKDVSTRRHSQRVAKIAVKICETLKLDAEQKSKVEFASILHDIGKLAIPAKILNKPGKLSEHEFLLIKSHPFYTYKLFANVNGMDDIARWAGYHHEKLDGSGYPFKVKKENLDLEARIIQVADITAALLEKRSYRRPLLKKETLEILNREAKNNKIDADIVKIAEQIVLEGEVLKLTKSALAPEPS